MKQSDSIRATLRQHELEAQLLRARHARDLLVRFAVGCDLLVRRAAAHLALVALRGA